MIWETHSISDIRKLVSDFIHNGLEADVKFMVPYILPLHKISDDSSFQLITITEKHGVLSGWSFARKSEFTMLEFAKAYQAARPAINDAPVPTGMTIEVLFAFFFEGRVLAAMPFSYEAAVVAASLLPPADYSIAGSIP